jgi:hypothetical protein
MLQVNHIADPMSSYFRIRTLAFAAKWQVTAANVALGKFRHVDLESGHAYLVVPVTLTYKKVGQPKMEKGIVTMSLKKGDSGWQITGWAWADL